MRARELFLKIGIELPESFSDREVSEIVTDSRKAVENCIFICIRGGENDGHDHIPEVTAAGACVIVAEQVRGECLGGAVTILVENARRTASLLYNVWFSTDSDSAKIVGVTGTNGKTSVTWMLYSMFLQLGIPSGMIGTLGAYLPNGKQLCRGDGMTTPPPQTLYRLLYELRAEGCEYIFMEVSSHALEQERCAAIDFECAVFTNLSEDHLDFHGSFENYYRAKKKLFLQSKKAIINIDDCYGKRLFSSLSKHRGDMILKTTSRIEGDFYALCENKKTVKGIEYTINSAFGGYRVFLPLFGDFQIDNSLSAIGTASLLGIPVEDAAAALGSISVVNGRLENVFEDEISAFVDYAHTPDALERTLKSLRQVRREGRIILLFGCGGEREREKRRLMGQIASRLADIVIVTSDNSRRESTDTIISDILKGINKEKEYFVIKDRCSAIHTAVCDIARHGDILLLAGKGHEDYQIDSLGTHKFDEKEILRDALDKRHCIIKERKERDEP